MKIVNKVFAVILDVVMIGFALTFWIMMDSPITQDIIPLAPDDANSPINEAAMQGQMTNLFRVMLYVIVAVLVVHVFVVILRDTSDRQEKNIGLG